MEEHKIDTTELIEKLIRLEYAIRQSMSVREDQEENIEPRHAQEAMHLGIQASAEMSKGDVLSLVQTALRAKQAGR